MKFLSMMFTNLPASNAGPGALNATDAVKILRMALVAGVGYALTIVVQQLTDMDFGAYEQIVQIALMGLTEMARRLMSGKADSLAELPANPGKEGTVIPTP